MSFAAAGRLFAKQTPSRNCYWICCEANLFFFAFSNFILGMGGAWKFSDGTGILKNYKTGFCRLFLNEICYKKI